MIKRKILLQILLILLIILQIIFIWHMDLSAGAWKRGNILTNGFLDFDPLQIYHISLYGLLLIIILFDTIIFLLINKNLSKS
jgi:hypothetical protein